MIGMSPNEAEKGENAISIRERQEENYAWMARKPARFKEGATVRISKLKGQFDRGFDKQFHEEIFKIKKYSPVYPFRPIGWRLLMGTKLLRGIFMETNW